MNNSIPFWILLIGLIIASIGTVLYVMWQQEGYETSGGGIRTAAIIAIIIGILFFIAGLIWMIVNFYRKSGVDIKTTEIKTNVKENPCAPPPAQVCVPCQ